MRKEVFFVILIGIAIGVVVAFGIYSAQQAITKSRQESPIPKEQSSQESTSEVAHTLIINEPQNESISEQETVGVVGVTTPSSVITIIAQENEYLLSADDKGKFSAEVSLDGGANTITISAFDQDGNRVEQVITVVYSTEL